MSGLSRCLRLGVLALALAAPAGALDLEGTWHVVAHYKDAGAHNKDAERWDDRVWVFEREGGRLRWTEYPIVFFDDDTGRFERRSTNRATRVLHYWEPNEAQLAELEGGPKVNPRGSRSKRLRVSGEGWRSEGSAAAPSASVITFTASWSIRDPEGLPVFHQEDVLGSGLSESIEGGTLYETEAVEEGGDVLRGRYDRDGARIGSFLARRTPPVRGLGSREEQEERIRRKREQVALETVASSPELQEEIRQQMQDALEAEGVYLGSDELGELVKEAVEMIRQQVPEEEIRARLARSAAERYYGFVERMQPRALEAARSGGFEPAPASHDGSARYALPFDPSVPRQLVQGVNGDFSHRGRHRYSFDFRMPEGTEVRAARAGVVARVVDGYTKGGRARSLAGKANVVTVVHADGTFANYVHLRPGIPVQQGQAVRVGDLLGYSGNTGYSTGPHLHFSVWRRDQDGDFSSVDVRFEDGSPRGFVPAEGLYYGGASAQAE